MTMSSEAPQVKPVYHPATVLRRLYDWVMHWADTPYALVALFAVAFAEASFFPIPPDVLLIAIGVGAPQRALWTAAVCLVGSVAGGIAGYAIGMGLWTLLASWFFDFIPGFTPEVFDKVSALYRDNAFWAVFAAGFSPIPYKVFTIAAGAAQIDFVTFVAASVLSRGLRFFLISGALRIFGPSVRRMVEQYFDVLSILFLILLLGGFFLVKLVL